MGHVHIIKNNRIQHFGPKLRGNREAGPHFCKFATFRAPLIRGYRESAALSWWCVGIRNLVLARPKAPTIDPCHVFPLISVLPKPLQLQYGTNKYVSGPVFSALPIFQFAIRQCPTSSKMAARPGAAGPLDSEGGVPRVAALPPLASPPACGPGSATILLP